MAKKAELFKPIEGIKIDFELHPRQFFGMFGYERTYDGIENEIAKLRDSAQGRKYTEFTEFHKCYLLISAAATLEHLLIRIRRLESIILGHETEYSSC